MTGIGAFYNPAASYRANQRLNTSLNPAPMTHKKRTDRTGRTERTATDADRLDLSVSIVTLDPGNKVFICSPFRPVGDTDEKREMSLSIHKELARYACRYAVANGYSPICPHLYYPEFLNDNMADEREIGILLGMVGLSECKELWAVGRRISEGMEKEIDQAKRWGIPVKRYIPRFNREEQLLKTIMGDEFPYIEMV